MAGAGVGLDVKDGPEEEELDVATMSCSFLPRPRVEKAAAGEFQSSGFGG